MQALAAVVCLMIFIRPQSRVTGAAILDHSPHNVSNSSSFSYEQNLDDLWLEERKQLLREEIVSRFDLEKPPEAPPDDLVLTAQDYASYTATVALQEATAAEERANERFDGCRERSTYYAQQIKLYFPSQFEGEIPSVDTFYWDSLLATKRAKRDKVDKDLNANGKSMKNDEKVESPPTHSPDSPSSPNKQPTSHPDDHYSAELKHLSESLTPIHYTISFDDIDLPIYTPIWSASLQLYKRKIISDNLLRKRAFNSLEYIEIYWMSSIVNTNGSNSRHPVLLTSQNIGTEDDQYISFDITDGVRIWLSEGLTSQLELKVVIRCPKSLSTGLLHLPSVQFDVPHSGNKDSNNANLIIKVVADNYLTNKTRTKRQTTSPGTNYCEGSPDEEICCLRKYPVDIQQDLGLTWVLAPRTLQVTYCAGLCPRVAGTLNSEYRSHLRAINPSSSPEPCCIPSKAQPFTLLALINSRIVLKTLTGLVVESCQCR